MRHREHCFSIPSGDPKCHGVKPLVICGRLTFEPREGPAQPQALAGAVPDPGQQSDPGSAPFRTSSNRPPGTSYN